MKETDKQKIARLAQACDDAHEVMKKINDERAGMLDENARLKRELEALRGKS